MKKVLWSLFFSTLTYIFVMSFGHNFYLKQVNQQLEVTIQELVTQIAEIQSLQAWDSLQQQKKQK